jgi:hypothetical protein
VKVTMNVTYGGAGGRRLFSGLVLRESKAEVE